MCDPENDGCYSEAVVVCAALPRRRYENTPGPLLKSCFYSSNNRSSIANGYVGRRHIGGINSKKKTNFFFFFLFSKVLATLHPFWNAARVYSFVSVGIFFFLFLAHVHERQAGTRDAVKKKELSLFQLVQAWMRRRVFGAKTCCTPIHHSSEHVIDHLLLDRERGGVKDLPFNRTLNWFFSGLDIG